MDISRELLQVFLYSTEMDNSFNSLAISVLSQIVQNCPEAYLFKMFRSTDATSPDQPNWEGLISTLFLLQRHY
ncbi:hypothetical protein SLA2020_433910 [Shorea laevis]